MSRGLENNAARENKMFLNRDGARGRSEKQIRGVPRLIYQVRKYKRGHKSRLNSLLAVHLNYYLVLCFAAKSQKYKCKSPAIVRR